MKRSFTEVSTIFGMILFQPEVFNDERGWLFESFNAKDFLHASNLDINFVQDNHSYSRQWALRGLHYQHEKTQGKLVRAVSGSVFDVTVDVRLSSPTYGKWFGAELSADNKKQLWIPPGIAHGFLVLSEDSEVLYKSTDFYYPEDEVCLAWNDPTLAIKWPLLQGVEPNLSPRDLAGLSWGEAPKIELS
jgi:dTDP-4-dehydrorhamnose 3,5-epimerase